LSSSFSSTRRDSFADDKHLFNLVVCSYLDCKELPIVCAAAIDADGDSRSSRKKTADTIHFTIDVEHATEAALKGDEVLETVWFALAQEKPCDANIARKVITACARLYAARGLDPRSYFRQIRQGSAIDRRKVAA
jgi:hypothetical protein